MKKVLLAGTAMGAASLIATSAMAEITVGGFGEFNMGVSDGLSDASDETFGTDFEIHFKGSKDTSIGTASIYAELEVNSLGSGSATSDNTTGFDEFDISLEGNWGKVILGNQDGASSQLNSNATGTTGAYNGMIGGARRSTGITPSGTSNITNGLNAGGSDNTKVTYMTPSMGGVQAGLSYYDQSADAATERGFSAGVKFSQDMGGASIAATAVYAQDSANDEATANAGSEADRDGYAFGLNVAMSGFGVGFGYLNQEVDATTSGGTDNQEVNGFNVGVAYTMGDTSLGLIYEASEYTDGANAKEETTEYGFGVKHNLGEGVSVTLGAHSGEADDNNAATTDDDYDGLRVELKTSW